MICKLRGKSRIILLIVCVALLAAGIFYLRAHRFAFLTVEEPVAVENLAIELAKCLPMSDMASKEKCDSLLKQINDFDACVMAGFSIMKSKPPQCAMPDGRAFTQKLIK